MPASPSWSRGRRSGTAVLSGEGREERCPILPGRRSDGESRPPSQRETPYSRCHYDSTPPFPSADRKSTRLNSSHDQISYAVFCLKKKKKEYNNRVREENCRINNEQPM